MTDKTPQQEYDEMFTALQTDDKYAAAMAYVMKKDFLSYMVTMFYLINCQRMMLKDFHLTVIKKLQGLVDGTNEKRNLALCLPVGCLSGDTQIEAIATKGDIRYQTCFDIAILAKTHFDSIQVRSLTDKGTQIWQECEVVQSGIQKVSKLRISDGEGVRSIKATETHKFLLNDGTWKELKDLKIGDEINVGYKPEPTWEWKVIEIQKDIEECETFDIICPTYHNYIANGIVVHNSGKSLLTEYFISWCFARSRDNAFVYTSHSEDLITKMSAEIRSICTFPMWQRLFGWVLKKDDRQKTNFSFEGAKNRTGLRAKAINSAITGLDAGNPAVDGFSGALIIDDPMDAGNAIYEIERENVSRIYKEKLATRRRTPSTPTILIMQRLHPEDLVGWADRNEPELWDIVKVPALNPDGTSFWEERYPASELEILQKRQGALFQAQYQQEPVITGGSVIKTEWFKYYQQHPKYERIFMTSDTAMKANEWNDYSVLQLWGKYQNGLYLIDMIRGKWEVPDLIQKTRDFVKKYRLWENRILLSALYIEDRGSGVGLIQQLRRETSVPILPLKPNKKDKVTRAKEIAYYIESGMVFLPQDKDYSFNRELLTEIELFSADGNARHDDILDCIVYSCVVGLMGQGTSIFDS